MSIQAKLFIDDKVFVVLKSTLQYNQPADSTGRPHSKVFGGLFQLVLESTRDNIFTEWAIHPTMMKNAKIVQTPLAMNGKSRTFELIDTVCIFDQNHFSGTDNEPMKNSLTLSPAILKLDGVLLHEKHWRVTDLSAQNAQPTVINQESEEEKKPKKCTVEFDADNGDIKNGKFGFDLLTNKLLRICDSDKTKLKNEYDPITVDEEEYFPPWVSMRKGQTITLNIKSKFKNKKEYQSVAIDSHPDFTFVPQDLKDASEIKITCNNTNENTAQVKVIADGKDAGAINFFYPEPKTVELRWVFVEINGNDEKTLTPKITYQKLTDYFYKSFNPALVDFTIQNQVAGLSDILSKKADLKKREYIKDNREVGDYIEDSKRGAVLNLGSSSVTDTSKIANGINAYFFNLKCIDSKKISSSGSYDMVGGLSPTGKGDAYLVLDDNKKITEENISHETMHAMGLGHTFKESPSKDADKRHTFNFSKTKNYMDYKNSKEHTFKYQWESLHNDSYSK